jgi:lysophospholipase L1-like esterase
MGGLYFNTPWSRLIKGGTTNRAKTAVLFGDSFFAPAGNGAPAWFGRGNGQGGSRLHPIMVNGVSGETLAQINSRWATDVLAYDPEWCILHGGTNDIFSGGETADTVIGRYETAITNAQAAGIKLLILTPPSQTAASASQKTTLSTVRNYLLSLSETGVTVCDTGLSLSTGDGVTADATKLADTVHPNATTGRQALADAIAPAIAAIS